MHDTYFVVAHFHYIMVGGAVMAFLGGIHFWWPKITGRMYPEGWGELCGDPDLRRLQSDVLPAVHPGLPGMPRRYHEYPPEFQVLQRMSTAGASILAVGYVLPLLYLLWSLRYGRERRPNPWGREGPGVANAFAAADRELPCDAGRDRRGLCLPARESGHG